MQFHLNGYRPGDPTVSEPHPSVAERPDGLPETADVLIVGAGPAGLVLAAQLAEFPDIRTVVVERKAGPLEVGQADGVACRTVEMFEAFGLADRLIGEAYWVNEVCFWRPDPDDPSRIRRTGRVVDTEEGLSEFPHVIVNQARMLAYLLDHMARSGSRSAPFYGLHATAVEADADGATVTLRHTGGEVSTIRAKYVVGCDGARSAVRAAIGRELVGDATDEAWGVMDVLAVTDFPDIRVKAAITSANGNILIIPREGGYLVRFYIELDGAGDRRSVTLEQLAEVANRILHPYSVEIKDVGWWSVYEIGQRLCDAFDDVPAGEERLPRVFIAGDACHTHSAKAGQGMNVSMADAWNLGWKLAAVLRGVARPELLRTYSERTAGGRQGADRLRSRVLQALPRPPGASGRPGDVPALLRRAGPLHGGRRDHLRPVADHRRRDVPAPCRRLPDRDALPLGPGDPAGRRQADAARPRRPRRRRVASLRLRRPRAIAARCELFDFPRLRDPALHARGRGPGRGDRSAGRLPAGAP